MLGLVRAEWAYLIAGVFATLLSVTALTGLVLAAGVAPLGLGEAALGGAALLFALRGLGVARVAMRYIERIVTHGATFRALAALRVWMFRGSGGAFGGRAGLHAAG